MDFLASTERDEGYTKYQLHHTDAPALASEFLVEIKKYRQKLFDFGLIGMYDDGIGFGNLSMRTVAQQFVISGSATGGKILLEDSDFCTVTQCDVDKNSVYAEGPIKASSESMTHNVLYNCDKTIQVVLHVHSMDLWKKLCGKVPTTGADVPYGTPEMAYAVQQLFESTDVGSQKIVAMAGHEEGIISFGESFEEAFMILMKHA